MSYRKRRDNNHKAVERALRDAGCEVEDLSWVGHGVPDLLVKGPRQSSPVLLVEVKNPGVNASHQKLTPAEAAFHARFPVLIVHSPQDAVSQVLAGRKTK